MSEEHDKGAARAAELGIAAAGPVTVEEVEAAHREALRRGAEAVARRGLTDAQVNALRYYAPGAKRDDWTSAPAARTHAKLEARGLTAWNPGAWIGDGRDETTAEGLAILADIDAAKR